MLNEEATRLGALEAGIVLVAILDLLASRLLDRSCGLRQIGRRRSRCNEASHRIYSPLDLDKWMWSGVN